MIYLFDVKHIPSSLYSDYHFTPVRNSFPDAEVPTSKTLEPYMAFTDW